MVFFFKQKTAYEMRISDWSSDVCSSDLYIVIGQTVLIRKGLIGTISNREQLDDPKYTIATKLGTTGDIAARKYFAKARIKAFESEAEATLEVRNGRADAFVYELPFNAVFVARYPGQVGLLKEPNSAERGVGKERDSQCRTRG